MRLAPERLTIGRMMIAVALLAAVLGAVLYRRENADIEQAMVSANLRAANGGDVAARRQAALQLAETKRGDLAPAAAALAAQVLGDADPQVREYAVAGLGRILSEGARRRVTAGQAFTGTVVLGDSGDEAGLVEVIFRAMGDPRPEVRRAAVEAFANLLRPGGRVAARLEPRAGAVLTPMLDHSDPAARTAAIDALSRLAAPPADAQGRAIGLLRADPDRHVRVAMIEALGRGWPTVGAYPILIARLGEDPTPEEWAAIMFALGSLPPPPDEVASALVRFMNADPSADWFIPQVLAKRGAAARPYLGAIRAVAERRLATPEPCWPALEALARIDPDSPEAQAVLAPLGRLLGAPGQSYDISWRQRQVELVLMLYGESAAPLVPTLRDLLHDLDTEIQDRAARILGRIGRPAIAAVGDLKELANHRRDWSREIGKALARLIELRDTAAADPR